MHRAVAAADHHGLRPPLHGLAGQLLGVAPLFGELFAKGGLALLQGSLELSRVAYSLASPCRGVGDQADFGRFIHGHRRGLLILTLARKEAWGVEVWWNKGEKGY